MSLVTQCPACKTRFRVSARELAACDGQVRCGRCGAVFDGRATLEPEARHSGAPPAGVREPGASAAATLAAPPPPPAAAAERAPARAGRRSGRWWSAASLLALAVLAGQLVHFYRAEIAARYPALRPQLERACELLGCTVGLPQRPALIAIEASDLRAPDPARPSLIRLTATLRNHAAHALAYPALDLVLTDARDHTLARRILLPADYLAPGRDPAAGIGARAEVTVTLDLDTGGLDAAGYRLELLPAPQP